MNDDPPGSPLNAGVGVPNYVGYTRPGSLYGTPEQALALADAYAGFQIGFFVNGILSIAVWTLLGVTGGEVPNEDVMIVHSLPRCCRGDRVGELPPGEELRTWSRPQPNRGMADMYHARPSILVLLRHVWLCRHRKQSDG